MKVAFLVIATKQHRVLRECVSWFRGEFCDFYVHIDKKYPTEDFYNSLKDFNNVSIIGERFDIYWGGFNMILAEIALMTAARRVGGYGRYVLLSDDSFPLRSGRRIMQELAEDGEFISLNRVQTPSIAARYEGFYVLDTPSTSARYMPIQERNIRKEDMRYFIELSILMKRGKKQIDNLYYGSQWWALSEGAIDCFMSSCESDQHLRVSFRFSAIPDEHYVHTVLGSSMYRDKSRSTIMFTDFSRHPKPYVFQVPEDLQSAMVSKQLFARKFTNDIAPLSGFIRDAQGGS